MPGPNLAASTGKLGGFGTNGRIPAIRPRSRIELEQKQIAQLGRRNGPIGTCGEGPSHCCDKRLVVESTAQTDDVPVATPRAENGDKPLVDRRLKKFKKLGRQSSHLVVRFHLTLPPHCVPVEMPRK